MGRIVLGAIVGGVIVFFWGAIAHMATPLGTMGLQKLPGEEAMFPAIKASIPEPGMYIFPGMDMSRTMTPEEQEAYMARLKAGPVGLMVVNPRGTEEMISPRQLLTELGTCVFAALLAAVVLRNVAGGYPVRAAMPAVMGVFGWASICVSYWNWYGFSLPFTIAAGVEELVGWLLAGLVLAAIVKPAAASPTPEAAS